MKRKFFSIQYKVLIASAILVLLPVFAVGYFSYLKASMILIERTIAANTRTVINIGSNIEHLAYNVNEISYYVMQNENVISFLKMEKNNIKEAELIKRKIYKDLMFFINSFGSVDSIHICNKHGHSFNINTIDMANELNENDSSIIESEEGKGIWIYDNISYNQNEKKMAYSKIRMIKDVSKIENDLGYLKINVLEKDIKDFYLSNVIGKEGDFYLVDKTKRILSSTKETDIEFFDRVTFNDLKGEYGHIESKIKGKELLYTYYVIKDMDLILINEIEKAIILEKNMMIRKVTLVISIISIIVCFFLAILVSYKLLSPLKRLRSMMENIDTKDFVIREEIDSNDEIGKLFKSFKLMNKKLRDMTRMVYLSKIKQKEAEFEALQAQINPHFLYNTLDTIYWMCHLENAYESCELIEALAKLFRFTLSNKKGMVTLEDELSYISQFCLIQEKRYHGDILFEIKVDVIDTDKVVIPKLSLQPFIENSIKHGILPNGGKGYVKLSIKEKDDRLLIEVADNGVGFKEKSKEEILNFSCSSKESHLGIKNVLERMNLKFGNSVFLSIYVNSRNETCVNLEIPMFEENV